MSRDMPSKYRINTIIIANEQIIHGYIDHEGIRAKLAVIYRKGLSENDDQN